MSDVAMSGTTRVASPELVFEVTPPPVVTVDGEPAAQAPISPSSAYNLLQLEMSHASVRKIALGLITNIHQRERDVAAYDEARNERLAYLERQVGRQRSTPPNTPVTAPQEDFVLNTDQAPDFFIPVRDGLWQPAYWVKQLPDGRIAGLLKTDGPDDPPYISDIFASPDNDPDVPTLPLPCWLLSLLSGSPAFYDVLRQEVRKTGSWALQAETTRYRNLSDHLKSKQIQLAQIEKEIKSLDEQRDLCEARLARSRFEEKVSILRTLTGPRDEPRLRKVYRGKKHHLPVPPHVTPPQYQFE